MLDASRGDVCIFNNTSAEHPETYSFLQRLTDFAESKGIPFFWTEFCTYEEKNKDRYARKTAYRMVNTKPYDITLNPEGFRSKGEVFEEVISHYSFLPSRQRRICTAEMKVKVKVEFLAEWFSKDKVTKRLGHDSNQPMIDGNAAFKTHLERRGKMTKEKFISFRKFTLEQDHIRHAQPFSSFSKIGKKHEIDDLDHQFIGFIGIRHDEPRRVERLSKIGGNEIIYVPLFDNEIGKKEVIEFWKERPELDIQLPYDTEKSNCVYCFMKGSRKLKQIKQDDDGNSDSPASLKWWVNIEKKYSRPTPTKIFGDIEIDSPTRNGFFGIYSELDPKAECYENIDNVPEYGLPCECFD